MVTTPNRPKRSFAQIVADQSTGFGGLALIVIGVFWIWYSIRFHRPMSVRFSSLCIVVGFFMLGKWALSDS
jgi:hypothetical protein